MTITIPLKQIAKVGKKLLVQIAGVCENYKEKLIVEEIDFETCPVECPFFRFDVERKRNICMEACPHNRQMKTPKVVYMNERHRYNIKKEWVVENHRLSKYQLLQLLTYHFLSVDSNGVVRFVSAKELSARLGCTTRTIKNNNQQFVKLGLIHLTNYDSDLFSVDIIGYENYHLTKTEGGTGYVQMTNTFMEALYSMDNVNAMRLAIRALLKFDDEVEVRSKEVCEYSYNDIKRFMPSNINHKKIIDELMTKTSHIFDIVTTQNSIFITLKEEYNGKIQKEVKEKEFKEVIGQHMDDINETLHNEGEEQIQLTPADIEDLAQLSMEYGVDLVVKSINLSVAYIQTKETPDLIKNIGGFIRTVIRNNFIRSIGKMVA